jgi:hypothetical protein
MALTFRLYGRPIQTELSSYLFNAIAVEQYLNAIWSGKKVPPPQILIELYFKESDDVGSLRGSNNSKIEDHCGAKIEIKFNEEYADEYQALLEKPKDIQLIPVEYYKVDWYSFANKPITSRTMPVSGSYIDATTMKLQNGTDYYLQQVIDDTLSPKEQVALAIAYRRLKEEFNRDPALTIMNKGLIARRGDITDKDLTLSIDVSRRTSWEANLVPYVDQLPFSLSGRGEQHVVKTLLALQRKVDKETKIILIEEPENHLSFSSMNKLIQKIHGRLPGKQLILTTHSPYVLNKLGLEKLILLYEGQTTQFTDLREETQKYFKKLSGYDTLRLVLAKKAILVEGPSDELMIQKAYHLEHGHPPIADGVDVINVRGLSFARFLDIAALLPQETVVVTDNDGNYQHNILDKYSDYRSLSNVKFCFSVDNSRPTLEPQIVGCNPLGTLNKIFKTKYKSQDALIAYMEQNKTDCALKLFETQEPFTLPEYIRDAVQ